MAPVASSGAAILRHGNLDGTATSWLEANWMFLSLTFAIVGLGALAVRYPNRDPMWHGWLAPVMYCIHQTEEHAYDFRGWHYSFVPDLNEGFIGRAFAAACPDGEISCPMDPKMTLFVNAGAIWVGFGGCMLAAAVNPRFVFAGYLCWGTAIVNGLFGHLLPALLTLSYNPGCVQSAVMVPLGVYVISRSQRPKLCVANGFLFHAIAFGMGLNVILRARAPEAAVAVITVVMALLVPLAIAWRVDHPRDKFRPLFSDDSRLI